jgi:hypothetical protein
MDLHEWPLDPNESVTEGHARVGEAARIDQGPGEVAAVQPVDEDAFMIRLAEVDFDPELGGSAPDPVVDLVERLGTIDLGLAGADEIEVGAVEDQDGEVHGRAFTIPPSTDTIAPVT